MSESLRVSAIVPVYNVEKFLERCVSSLVDQTLGFYEVILVDDGSTDSSGALCDRYAERFENIHVVHRPNGGLSEARNTGISVSTGDFLTFIDSDDWISPIYNEVLCDALIETQSDISVCGHVRAGSQFCFKSDRYKQINEIQLITYTSSDYLDIMLRYSGNRCVHYAWGKLYRRDILEKEHFPPKLYNEDVEGFFKSLINSSRVTEVIHPSPLYCYFVNQNSITGKKFGQNYLDLLEVWDRVVAIAQDRRPDLVEKAKYNRKRTDFTVLYDVLVHGTSESDLCFADQINRCLFDLRSNLGDLLKGPMPMNRKISVTVFAYFFGVVRRMFRLTDRAVKLGNERADV